MCGENETQVTQIRLLGFQSLHKYRTLLFIVFLLTYIFILAGNLLIILLISVIDHLKTPMYFFLKHLSISDVLLTTSIVPLLLHIIITEEGILSFRGCIFQLFLFIILGCFQCFLIAVMSYDRYLAICHPLRYSSLMSPDLCLQLVFGAWFLDSVLTISEIIVIIQSNFCGLNYIDHFFCDFGPVVELATSDNSVVKMQDFVFNIFIFVLPFIFIVMTYICIFLTILKRSFGKRKAFSTCSSHLITVCVYYGSYITVYMFPSDESSSHINKYKSLCYLVVAPLLNPIIYSLRNHEIKKAVQKITIYILKR
ncbi:olfactory receptor 6B1-like [Hyla sarda]|uniref:olfactory receptor 6B1-like n=1 Tax=Hyla sarda TaxID=327740 RepID=UPI0024C2AF5A|nr:olfactory receptor 6B1-like [Hyla sarda]